MDDRVRIAGEAGLVAAVVSSLPGIAWVVAVDQPWWKPVQLIATLVGVEATETFTTPVFLLGGVMHLLLSVAYAVVFERVAPAWFPPAWLVVAGIAWGVVIFAVNFGLTGLLGWFAPVHAGSNQLVELAAHVIYGGVVAAWVLLRRRSPTAARRPSDRRRPR